MTDQNLSKRAGLATSSLGEKIETAVSKQAAPSEKLSFFPQSMGIGGEVTDFDATVFPGAGGEHEKYLRLVQSLIRQAGLYPKAERVSFARGVLVGKARPFFTIA